MRYTYKVTLTGGLVSASCPSDLPCWETLSLDGVDIELHGSRPTTLEELDEVSATMSLPAPFDVILRRRFLSVVTKQKDIAAKLTLESVLHTLRGGQRSKPKDSAPQSHTYLADGSKSIDTDKDESDGLVDGESNEETDEDDLREEAPFHLGLDAGLVERGADEDAE